MPNIIKSLPNKNSSGHDNISNVIFKRLLPFMSKMLTHICNLCFSNGSFPDIMKIAEVCLLFKFKERFLLSNCRPISLLTTMSKCLEKAIHRGISKFFRI